MRLHMHDVLQRGLADRHGAGERMEDADLDGLLRVGAKRCRKAERQSRRGDKEMPGERSHYDRSDGCLHRDVLLFDARQTVQSRLHGWNRKRHAKPSN